MARGFTLFELCAALLLASVALGAAVPGVRSIQDRLAVVAAREAVAGLIAEARTVALHRGGASVSVTTAPPRAWSEAGDSLLRTISLDAELHVSVHLSRGKAAARLRYDALGLGQVASETLRFRRGDAEASLVVSGYGRVRRR